MAKPSDTPTWATDTNYTNGPDAGTATKIEPSAGEQAEGWIGGEKPPGQWMNWWMNLVYQWVAWLNSLGIDVSSGEIVYDTPKTRTIWVPGTAFRSEVAAGVLFWDTANDGGGFPNRLKSINNNAKAYLDLHTIIPTGSTVTQVQVQVNPGAARSGTNRMFAVLQTHDYGGAAANDPTITGVDSDFDDTTGIGQFITLTGSVAVDNTTKAVRVGVQAGNDGATNNDYILGAFVTFTNPGLRVG